MPCNTEQVTFLIAVIAEDVIQFSSKFHLGYAPPGLYRHAAHAHITAQPIVTQRYSATPLISLAPGCISRARCRCAVPSRNRNYHRSFFAELVGRPDVGSPTACLSQLCTRTWRRACALCDQHQLGILRSKFLPQRCHSTRKENRIS